MNSRIRVVKDILWSIAIAGLVAAIFRLVFGLGLTTNLTDGVPWGFWKVFNMIAGVALSTSGFTVGFLVYVLRIKSFKPYLKPAILIAFLGYGCSCLALLFDIGLPFRFWHPMIMWNINSFLFEVFWCVMLYFTVTAIELAPIIFEKLKAERIAKALHGIAFVVVIIGISLSSLHHSSLGSLFLVSPQRLHPLWYSPWLPLFFIISAMGAGIMFLVLVRIIWAKLYDQAPIFGDGTFQSPKDIADANGLVSALAARQKPGPEMIPLRRLASIGTALLGLYLILKLGNLLMTNKLSLLWSNTPEIWLYLTEIGLGAVLPVIIMLLPNTRRRPVPVAVAAFGASFGMVLNRLNVGIFGYFRDAGQIYFPSLAEWALGFGVIAAAGLVFMAATEYLPVFGPLPASPGFFNLIRKSIGTIRQTWNVALSDSLHRISLVAVFVFPLAFVLMYPPFFADSNVSVKPSLGVDIERKVLRIDGDRGNLETIFDHFDHQKRMGDSASCVLCHHVSFPNDRSTPCSRCHARMFVSSNIFDHDYHTVLVAEKENLQGWHPENASCNQCHAENSPKAGATAKNCLECHRQDMYPPGSLEPDEELMNADSFCDAMHGTCLECHKKEAALKEEHKDLDKCHTCHKSLLRKAVEPSIALMDN